MKATISFLIEAERFVDPSNIVIEVYIKENKKKKQSCFLFKPVPIFSIFKGIEIICKTI